MTINRNAVYRACLATSFGSIIVKLTPKTAPIAVNNFVFLSLHRFYTNILFHRVIKGFMIQTGDPLGTGVGGAGYSFPIEQSGSVYPPGTLAMANTGQPNSNGSQFFICQGAQCSSLNGSNQTGPGYTIFGNVSAGMAVVNAIAKVPVVANSQGEVSSPKSPVYLKSVAIYRSP
ncbi:MAG TPA: peptidylprolyl isomerase [Chloroflexota bacterium]|jgi:cyclophilin family peptidyl-prolyl cis-trans isomerase|nr:peptidylprolyl isomerase [Chloroflexota bacterium]